MTDLLKDTLTEHANNASPPALDLDAVISTGDRRIRRRRTVAVLGTAMVTLAVVATGFTVLKPAPDGTAPVATSFSERRATYAVGSDIHYGSDVISVAPRKVHAFVQTDAGFVFTTTDSGLFLANGNQVRRLGEGPGQLGTLTAATGGNLVGWIDSFNDRAESVIFDVGTRRELVRTALGNMIPPNVSIATTPRIIAIDDGYAYLGTLRGVYRWDLNTGENQLLLNSYDPRAIRALSANRYVLDPHPEHPTGPDPAVVELRDLPGKNLKGTYPGKQGYLSPSAKYLLTGTNDPSRITPPPTDLKLFDTTTRKQLPLAHPNHPRLIFNQWLTDNTFTAAGVRTDPKRFVASKSLDLLACSTETLTCQVTAPAFSTLTFTTTPPRTAPFTLPVGTPIYWLYG